ncbi:MAG TPA: Nramp family divalent metal transporter [Gammaproteobacteria bacterium]|nr:Nramp family divalent metal transporter [Gammaproteobacteria bacterium]
MDEVTAKLTARVADAGKSEAISPTLSVATPPYAGSPIKAVGWRGLVLAGPGVLVAVGYIDPGNWATDIAGGSYAGYALLSVVFISSLLAMLLQIMSARLGIATGKDLAESSREQWPRLVWPAWIAAELTIVATDLAEVIGSAIALKLLFAIPIILGVVLTSLDVFLLLMLDRRGSRLLERIIISFLFIIACGFVYELALAQPAIAEVLRGFLPSGRLVFDSQLLYLSLGVIGATVMPHNLYLHSNLVLQRYAGISKVKAGSIAKFNTLISLSVAMLLNAALVVLAASVFHQAGHLHVTELSDAHRLLVPLLGTGMAALVFAIMLLAAGQSATITGTLAGQVVMCGFIRMRMKPWLRRLVTRMLALVPALFVLIYFGERSTMQLLVGSQVFLSLQLPLAMVSLLRLTSDKRRMGLLVNSRWMRWLGWLGAIIIILANVVLIIEMMG